MVDDAEADGGPEGFGGIVVGVDGSDGGRDALVWAARLAERRGCPITILLAVSMPLISVPFGRPVRLTPTPEVADRASNLLRIETDHVAEVCPGLTVRTHVSAQEPVPALVRASATADLVVVGSRGLGGIRAAFLGSVSLRVGTHASCPVAVVPPGFGHPYEERGRVAVGVDGSPDSADALRFALDEAARTGASVTAVHAWSTVPPPDPLLVGTPGHLAERAAVAKACEDASSALIAGARTDRTADVPVDLRVVEGQPAYALITAGQGADLIAVGSRGRGGFTGLLLGSVSQTVLHHTDVPVVVARSRRS